MVCRRYHCYIFDFIDTIILLLGYSIYTGTASTLYCRRAKIIIIRIDIQLIDIRYPNLWTHQQAYSIRGRHLLCRAIIPTAHSNIYIDRPFHIPIGQAIGID